MLDLTAAEHLDGSLAQKVSAVTAAVVANLGAAAESVPTGSDGLTFLQKLAGIERSGVWRRCG